MPRRIRPLAATLILLCACQAPPEPSRPAAETRIPWEVYDAVDPGEGRVYDLVASGSDLRIHVYRAGALAARGHNHVITAPELEGAVLVPADRGAKPRFDLLVAAAALEVDDAAARRALGYSFAGEVADDAREGTRRNLLGPRVLDVERFPLIGASSRAVAGELPKLAIAVALTLRGVTREQWVPVDVQVDDDRLVAQGALTIRQSEFGMEPFSALGGLLRVDDVVTIDFRLVGKPR